jgi:hypothetical protein
MKYNGTRMRRPVLLALGAVGLVTALVLAGVLTVRRAPTLTSLRPVAGVTARSGAIEVTTRAGTTTLDPGWCASVARPVPAGVAVTAWTDTDRLGRTRVWRIEQDTRPVCRFTESTAAVAGSNRTLRVVALLAAAGGLLAFAALVFESWRALPRG